MKKLLQSLFICMFSLSTTAQDRIITGTVTDKNDRLPLPGVYVKAKGINNVTTAGPNGKYAIKVSANVKELEFSSLGYHPQSIVIDTLSRIDVALIPDTKQLEEVIVTAMSITKTKRALGYAIQNIKGEQLTDRGDINILNVLQGKIAGVEITGASGSAGASTNIILRGISSFSGSNQPLFLVDGIPISNDIDHSVSTLFSNQPANRVLDLNLNNIESINILQGPAAAALYGSRASNGAIIITTKKGSGEAGKTEVNFNAAYGQQNVYGLVKLQDLYGQGSLGILNGISPFSFGPAFGSAPSITNGLIVTPGTTQMVNGIAYKPGDIIPYQNFKNNIRDYFQRGVTWENNLSINSGDAKNNYNFNIGNSNAKGILPGSAFKKTNVGFSASSALNDKLALQGSINYFNTIQRGTTTHGNGGASSLFGIYNVTRSTDLKYFKDHYKNANGSNNWFIPDRENPYFSANENTFASNLSRFMGNVNLGYDLFKWLNISYRLGLDTYTDRRKRFIAIGSTQATGNTGSVLNDQYYRNEINGDLLINAKKNDLFIEGLNVNVLLGQNINQQLYQNVSVSSLSLDIPGYENVKNGKNLNGSNEVNTTRRLLGYYGQASFGYHNYLFLELTGRVDQSSTLPVNNNTYFYPSVSSSFVFSDALDLQSDIFSMGKIRASFAKVGRDALPYRLQDTYTLGFYGNNTASFTFPFTTTQGSINGYSINTRISNPNLKPEFTSSYEFGTNLSFFKNRINLDATYYNQRSKNQIVNVAMPASSGFTSRTTNIGEITNKGLELALNVTAISSKNLSWDISANFSKNVGKVVSIAPGVTSFQIAGDAYGGLTPSVYINQPYGVIVGSKYQRSPSGELLVDKNTGLYNSALIPNQIIADPNRDWSAGLSNVIKYKKLTLSALVDFKKGGDIVSWTAGYLRSVGAMNITAADRDAPHILPGVIDNGDGTYSPNNIQITGQNYWSSGFGNVGGGEFTVFDATTLRLREVTIGYDIGNQLLKTKAIKNIRVTIYGRNLYYYAPNSPIDPEVNTQGAGNIRGLELQSAPNTRNFGISLRAAF